MVSQLQVKNKKRFGIVPDRVLERKDLSLPARAVAAWLAGRQNGFTINISALRDFYIGISEKQWASIRKELEGVGWWRSKRTPSGVRGRFVWEHEFCEDGFDDEPATIPPLSRDGQSMHAQGGDIPVGLDQKDVNHPLPPVDEMLEAAVWEARQHGVQAGPGWKMKVKKRLESAAAEIDVLTWKKWRLAMQQAKRQTALQASNQALEAEREKDPTAAQRGAEKFGLPKRPKRAAA